MLRSNIIIDGESAMRAVLAESLGLAGYEYIMAHVREVDVSCDADFQRRFNHFYRVRKNAEWRSKYYCIFEEMKRRENADFSGILYALHDACGSAEASFASKMLATIDAGRPIWDSRVLAALGLEAPAQGKKERLEEIVEGYKRIEDWYKAYLASSDAEENIKAFDRMLPEHESISPVKKIDYILWAAGAESR